MTASPSVTTSASPTLADPVRLSPLRTRLALLALALGGFAIGTTEFVAMGLLPNLASDLLPGVWAVSETDATAQAGMLISAYALGVVVGAPTIAAMSGRFPRKQLILGLLVAFTLGTIASALLPSFGLVLAARFVAGLPHGAYFGVAALVAANLMGPGKRGQGIAIVLAGLTIANVIGVPAITFLGQLAGWRIAYLAVAALFAVTFVAVWIAVPLQAGDPHATMRRELKAFSRIQVWLALGIGAIGFGGFFAVYSYVNPLATNVTGLDVALVPFVLVVLGLGMTVGNLVGGRMSDWKVMPSVFIFFGAFLVSLVGLALTAETVPGLLVFLFLSGGSASALSPAVQSRLMEVAGDSQNLAAALNHAALNIGNSLGAYLGGVTIAAGLGYLSATWVAVALIVPGAIFAVLSVLVEFRQRARVAGASAQSEETVSV
ncbi:MAG: transporter [Glaciihabitans sp.]|nr:transporter [Glaciihabitans sp.]